MNDRNEAIVAKLVGTGGILQFGAMLLMLVYLARYITAAPDNTDPMFVTSVLLFLIGSILATTARFQETRNARSE